MPSLQPTAGAVEVADRVRHAIDARTSLRVVGNGLWLDAGGPCHATTELSVRPLSGIVEFVPGDLTLTARAGTTLGEIADATAGDKLWFPLDPPGSDEGTLGATVATASAGALSTGCGLPRDMVIGVEAVTGRGAVIRGGGRVVKNVAGFDLTRMLTGSWGTLGVLTEVSVRLRARPERDETIAVAIGESAADIERIRCAVRSWPFTPIAAELLNSAMAASVTSVAHGLALFRVAGNDEAVRAQRAAIVALGDIASIGDRVWHRLRGAEPKRASVVRLSALPTRLSDLWQTARELGTANGGVLLHATPARGVVRCIVPSGASPLNTEPLDRVHCTQIWERVAGPDGPEIETKPRSSLAVERRLLETFNPFGVLNPGVLITGGHS